MDDPRLDELAERLVGKEIWRLGTAKSLGNSFSLAIGDRVPREAPLKGPVDEFSNFRGEFGLYVWCTWDFSFDGNWELEYPGGALNVGPGDKMEFVLQRPGETGEHS